MNIHFPALPASHFPQDCCWCSTGGVPGPQPLSATRDWRHLGAKGWLMHRFHQSVDSWLLTSLKFCANDSLALLLNGPCLLSLFLRKSTGAVSLISSLSPIPSEPVCLAPDPTSSGHHWAQVKQGPALVFPLFWDMKHHDTPKLFLKPTVQQIKSRVGQEGSTVL